MLGYSVSNNINWIVLLMFTVVVFIVIVINWLLLSLNSKIKTHKNRMSLDSFKIWNYKKETCGIHPLEIALIFLCILFDLYWEVIFDWPSIETFSDIINNISYMCNKILLCIDITMRSKHNLSMKHSYLFYIATLHQISNSTVQIFFLFSSINSITAILPFNANWNRLIKLISFKWQVNYVC